MSEATAIPSKSVNQLKTKVSQLGSDAHDAEGEDDVDYGIVLFTCYVLLQIY